MLEMIPMWSEIGSGTDLNSHVIHAHVETYMFVKN